ncbi:heavy metal translocating P-type ATPase [Enterococcus faecalis]|uniref:heavy metal translocating P-type ATPase n=1 Tax=Enterococcus faecalis TaxID=1351 RepID=UPI0002D6EFAE|nr:heavy metal translocating P-type ATPase [Enterococcus faecalis]EGO2671183.1 heavy metal translocating P-type ATPase [Enterococcus faecalis]EGO2671820.1 heavy metal translocating P-type ATPase [Enterococcus faecalis]EGO6773252.1 heavy metal translocating P-type ATPase [Enterococcus faecalis]EGO6773654.1 heavy metal translocating P-type ATPase [Enterococcus faecalis]EGO8517837.1 heavy metal translocating P-type ATPase [Enterococcus faecalis]
MQQYILRHKNQIAVVSGLLIVIGFLGHLVLHSEWLFNGAFIIASIIGVAPIAIQAYQAMKVKVISIDILVTIAVLGAFLIRNFEESAIVTFLFLLGSYLEQRTLNQTRSAIKELTEMTPETALKEMEDGTFEEVDIDEVDEGDLLLVKTGAKIPVDGTVFEGQGHVNEANITGESFPVKKVVDDEVFAGTILDNGTMKIVANKIGEDSTFGKIIELVEEAQDSKSEAERFIDRFSRWYTPLVLLVGILVWIFTQNVEIAVTVLVLGCPGALVIGVPVSNVAGIGNGAKNGVLFKGSEVISDFSNVDTILFDKTGTLTEGNPQVAETIYYDDDTENTFSYLASVERESDHPLALAILEELGDVPVKEVTETSVVKGGGIVAQVAGRQIAIGNPFLMEEKDIILSDKAQLDVQRLADSGHSLVMTAVDGELKVMMGIRDQVRDGVKNDLAKLKVLGVKNLIVLSGDNQGTVDLVKRELGLTEAYGSMLPEDKQRFLKDRQTAGEIVAFVGDGVNDSPSLASAEIGIAMGGGTDVAIETSDVVLMNSNFNRLPHALSLAQATYANMQQNIVIAIGVVIVLLASLLFSDWMSMSIGMLVHEASILVVIFNAMRLRGHKEK